MNFSAFNASRIERYDLIEVEQSVDGSEIETYAAIGKKQAMVSGRIQIDTKYFYPCENLFIISGKGNEEALKPYKA